MLLVHEIYSTICGESRFLGRSCTLVRLTGCHLRCAWCDSEHAFQGGDRRSVDDVVADVAARGFRTVLVTGGEPLLQKDVVPLMERLLEAGHEVLLETSGTHGPDSAVSLDEVPADVHRVVDLKAPGSGIDAGRIDWDGISGLGERDEVKIVCRDRADFEWALEHLRAGRVPAGVRTGFSPVFGQIDPADLAAWVLADRLDAVVQVQLHRVLWPDQERGV